MARAEDFTIVVAVLGGTGTKGSASMVGAAKARAKKTAWLGLPRPGPRRQPE